MLKNKFGMTKILVLVLSVLMLVSLVACNKADGPSTDDMNSAIQSAIDAANAEAAAREAALASSIAAAEAEAAAREAALASSLKAEAEKAAADAAAKAEAEASKEASKLAAELAAAEAAASKAQAEASKAAESAKQASIAASKAASEAAEAAKTTTGGNNPGALVDKSAVLAEYSKLKTEYTYTNRDYYLADDYAALVLLFDKASVDLNNALTVDAATSVLETLKVDAAAIESAKTAANEVQALIAALGDIETEVFTTQAEKIVAAREAYTAMKVAYADFFKYDVKEEADYIVDIKNKDNVVIKTVNETVALAEELGVEVDELENAESKLDVLEGYIAKALFEDMKVINDADPKHRFDVEDAADRALIPVIENAYYKYLVLSVLNGGDVAAADMPIEWEWKLDKEGEPVKGDPDYDKPTEWFTVEELLEVYILPTLDYKFADYTGDLAEAFRLALPSFDTIDFKAGAYKPVFTDYDDDLDDIYDALVDKFEALSFVDNYKGNATLDDAKADANTVAIQAYIEALNVYLTAAKAKAIEVQTDAYELKLEQLENKIDDVEDEISETESETKIERLNTKLNGYKADIVTLQNDLKAFSDHVTAATLLTYEEMLNEELSETKAYKDNKWVDISLFEIKPVDKDVTNDIKGFLNLVLANTIEANFKAEIKVSSDDENEDKLFQLIDATVADLEALRALVSYEEDEEGEFYEELRGTATKYLGETYYPNHDKFVEIVALIDAAIADIEAKANHGYADIQVPIMDKDGKKVIYYKDAASKAYAIENEFTLGDIVCDKDGKGSKDGVASITVTEFPVEYTYTGAAQAANDVATIYVDTYKAVNTELVALDAVINKDAIAKLKEGVTKHTAYTAIANTLDGTLKADVVAVATTYADKIGALSADFANNSTLKVDLLFTKTDKYVAAGQVAIIPTGAEGVAASYDYANYKSKVAGIVSDFEKAFFVSGADKGDFNVDETFEDDTLTLDMTKSKIVELWNAKLAAVADARLNLSSYKNTYKLIVNDEVKKGFYTFTPAAQTYNYDYDEPKDMFEGGDIEVIGKSDIAVAYEAELDALVASCTEAIMNIKINDKLSIKNGRGEYVKYEVEKADGTVEVKEFKDVTISNLVLAEAAMEAYIDALLGTPGYVAYANIAGPNSTKYDRADSLIFQAYNTIVLKNTYGTTRPQATVTVDDNIVNGTVTVSGTPYNKATITVNASGAAATYEEDGETVKTPKYVVQSITVLENGVAIDPVEGTTNKFVVDYTKSYTVSAVFTPEIVIENGDDDYEEDEDGNKTYNKGTMSAGTGYGEETLAKVTFTGKDYKVKVDEKEITVGTYVLVGATVTIDGEDLDEAAVTIDGKAVYFEIPEDAEEVIVTPEYEISPKITLKPDDHAKAYINDAYVEGDDVDINIVVEDGYAIDSVKIGEDELTVTNNTVTIADIEAGTAVIEVVITTTKAAE